MAARERKIAGFIVQARLLATLPALDPPQLKAAAFAWGRALAHVSDELLEPGFQRAVETNEGKPLTAADVRLNAEAIALERARGRDRQLIAAAARNPGTYACWLCEDLGYQRVSTFCPKLKTFFVRLRPCECDRVPESQRRDALRPPRYEKGADSVWQPTSEDALRCTCVMCLGRV